MITEVLCTPYIAIVLPYLQLTAYMHASNSSNQSSQAVALCTQPEQWEQAMHTEDLVIQ